MNTETEIKQDIADLNTAALKLATRMLGMAPDRAINALDHAVKSGGRIVMELGPFPDPKRVSLVLIEPEGSRITICNQSWELQELH